MASFELTSVGQHARHDEAALDQHLPVDARLADLVPGRRRRPCPCPSARSQSAITGCWSKDPVSSWKARSSRPPPASGPAGKG